MIMIFIVGNEDQTYSEEDWPVFWDVWLCQEDSEEGGSEGLL